MSNAPKKILLKPSTDRDGSSESDVPAGEKGLSVSELKALHERLAALRAADAVPKTEEKEPKSVRALIAYAACDLGVNEEIVGTLVKSHFDVPEINLLLASDYDELVRYLGSLDIKQFIH
jgi:hypothetical protein